MRIEGAGPGRIFRQLTVEAHDRPPLTPLRLLTVLNVGFKYTPHYSSNAALSGARLVLTGLSRTSLGHLVRKRAGWNAPQSRGPLP